MASYNKSFNFRNGVQVDDDNFIVNANGLVGIGTSIPREFLDVYGTAKVTGLVTTTNLAVSGVSTFYNDVKVGSAITLSHSTGAVRATTFYGSAAGLTGVYAVAVDGWYVSGGTISTTSKIGLATTNPQYSLQIGNDPFTSTGVGLNSTGNVYISGIVTARTASVTNITTTNLTSTASTTTSLTVSGTGAINTLNAPVGVVTTLSGTTLNYSGTSTLGTLSATTGTVTTLSGTNLTYGTAGITTLTTTTGTITNLTNTNLTSTASTISYINNTNLRTTGIATIQTLKTVDGDIAYFTGENGSYTGTVSCNTLNVVSGVVTTLSGTTLTYGGTGSINTLNATTGIVTTISGTTLTYSTAGITTLTTTTGTITNLSSTNINSSGIITATGGFRGSLTGTASSATQLVTSRNFSIIGSFLTASASSFDGTGNVALAATITANSIGLGTYTNGNYVKSISGATNQINVSGSPTPGGQPQIGLTDNVTISNNLSASGIITATNGFTSGIGTAVQITTIGNRVIFTVVGVGSTSLTLF